MKKILSVIFLLMTLCPVSAQEYGEKCRRLPLRSEGDLAFGHGEMLKYVIHYKWLGVRMDVGEASVSLYSTTHNGRKAFHANAKGGTYRFWDSFFKVRDHYEASFYIDNLRPYYFHRDIHEGNYTIRNTYYWNDYTNGINALVERKNKAPMDTLMKGHECTFDILTLLYFARNLDFEKIAEGVNHPVSFAIDDEIFNIYFRYIGKEVKKVPRSGKYNTLKFAAKVVAGEVFTGEQEMIIWVSDDENRIPLLFMSPIRVGAVYGRLSDYRNLKYPLHEAD